MPRLYQRTSAPPPEKLRPFTTFALRRFYASGFEETDAHRRWAGLWRKQLKLRLSDGAFISLNKLRPRFSFQSLRRYSVRFAPVNLCLETVGEVAKITDIDEFEELLGIPAKVLHRIRLRALSYASGEVLQTESFEFPGGRLVYIDVETDPACMRH